MIDLLKDPNFYILISVCCLVIVSFDKCRGFIGNYLKKHINKIAKEITDATCEKDKALLDLMHANQSMINLPKLLTNIWDTYELNIGELQLLINEEVKKQENINNLKLEQIQQQKICFEYYSLVKTLCEQFKEDLSLATESQHLALVKQSVDLLDSIDMKT